MEQKITCIICPKGCLVTVKGEGGTVSELHGFDCNRGENYATAEFICPVRVLTSTVRATNGLIAVRSNQPLPKDMQLDCMKLIRQVHLDHPVAQYDVIIPNICGTGVDIVATSLSS